jgi:DNA repair exonuclease SbcCD ATPase subunit
MIKILSVNPTGCFSYGIHRTVYVDGLGTTLLDGKNLDRNGGSNGSGKTSLFNTITQILYDRNPADEIGEKTVNTLLNKKFARIVFLDAKGTKWRVTDVKRWRKSDEYPDKKLDPSWVEDPSEICNQGERYHGTDVYLERWDDKLSLWMDERNTNNQAGAQKLDLRSTRRKIVSILGMDYEQYMSITYLAQQQATKFINGTHKDKLEVLNQICELSIWDERRDRVKQNIVEREATIVSLRAELSANRMLLGDLNISNIDYNTLYETRNNIMIYLETVDSQLKNIQSYAEARKNDIQKITSEIAASNAELRSLLGAMQGIQNEEVLCTISHNENLFKIKSTQPPTRSVELSIEMSETRGLVAGKRFDLEQLMQASGKCPHCRSIVTADHIARQKELLSLEIESLNTKIVDLSIQFTRVNKDFEDSILSDISKQVDKFELQKASIQQRLVEKKQQYNNIEKLVATLNESVKRLESDPLPKLYDEMAMKRMQLLADKLNVDSKISSYDEKKRKAEKIDANILDLSSKINFLETELNNLNVLERLFGDKGIKSYKLSGALHMLNQLIDTYLTIVTDGFVKAWVTPYRTTTKGEETSDIQIVVKEGPKDAVPFGLYSGGERQQLVLAFIGAFWEMGNKSSVGTNILCLDEIFGPLDKTNIPMVLNYIDHIKKLGASSVFIVTHDQTTKDESIFDKTWTVVKQNHQSTIQES